MHWGLRPGDRFAKSNCQPHCAKDCIGSSWAAAEQTARAGSSSPGTLVALRIAGKSLALARHGGFLTLASLSDLWGRRLAVLRSDDRNRHESAAGDPTDCVASLDVRDPLSTASWRGRGSGDNSGSAWPEGSPTAWIGASAPIQVGGFLASRNRAAANPHLFGPHTNPLREQGTPAWLGALAKHAARPVKRAGRARPRLPCSRTRLRRLVVRAARFGACYAGVCTDSARPCVKCG